MVTQSSSPSPVSAPGAMTALLPYCEALATAISQAWRSPDESGGVSGVSSENRKGFQRRKVRSPTRK